MSHVDRLIESVGIIPVVKLDNPSRDARPLAKALLDGGIPIMEVTFRASGAEEAIASIKDDIADFLVGAGTVTNVSQIDRAVDAGAEFVVTPGFDSDLVAYAQKKGIAIYPGCSSATDYHAAVKHGLDIVKFFPAVQEGGLSKIKALAGPFSSIRTIPTGGITLDNLGEYAASPFVAACGGTYMAKAGLIEEGRWAEISELARASVKIVSEARRAA